MATLFEIGNERLRLLDTALSADESGEIDAELLAFLEANDEAQSVKIDGYLNLIKAREMLASKAREEAELYTAAARRAESEIERLKARLKEHLERTGQPKVTTATGRTVAVVKNGGKAPLDIDPDADIEMVEALCPHYVRTKREWDKDAIRAALEAGQGMSWARLGERGVRISVR